MNIRDALIFVNMLHVVRVTQISTILLKEKKYELPVNNMELTRTLLALTYVPNMTDEDVAEEFLRMQTVSK